MQPACSVHRTSATLQGTLSRTGKLALAPLAAGYALMIIWSSWPASKRGSSRGAWPASTSFDRPRTAAHGPARRCARGPRRRSLSFACSRGTMDILFQCPEALRAEWWFGLRVAVGEAPGRPARSWRLPDELADLRRHAGYFPASCVRLAPTVCTPDSNSDGVGGGAFLRAASTSTCTSPTISSPEAESRSTLCLDDDDPEDTQTLGPLPLE
jgi:hypothetical protein